MSTSSAATSAQMLNVPHIHPSALSTALRITPTATATISPTTSSSSSSSHQQHQQHQPLHSLFSRSPLVHIRRPSLWPAPPTTGAAVEDGEPRTNARLAWNVNGLLILYDVGSTFAAPKEKEIETVAETKENGKEKSNDDEKMSILRDSRIEVFIAPTEMVMNDNANNNDGSSRPDDESDSNLSNAAPLAWYRAYEINRAGSVLDFTVTLPTTTSAIPAASSTSTEETKQPHALQVTKERQFDYSWKGNAKLLTSWCERATSTSTTATVPTQAAASSSSSSSSPSVPSWFMLIHVPWSDVCTSSQQLKQIHEWSECLTENVSVGQPHEVIHHTTTKNENSTTDATSATPATAAPLSIVAQTKARLTALAASKRLAEEKAAAASAASTVTSNTANTDADPSSSSSPPSSLTSPLFHIGLYRGERIPGTSSESPDFYWQSAIDPLSSDVTFHTPSTFTVMSLSPPEMTDVTEVIPEQLYLTSLLGLDDSTLMQYGITHIVNVAAKEIVTRRYDGMNIARCEIYINDSLSANLFNIPKSTNHAASASSSTSASSDPLNIIDAYRFMSAAIASGGRVLVHCAQGKSRSVSIILFYLIKQRQIHAKTALKELKAKRPIAQPNPAFMQQLCDYCASEEIVE